MSASTKCLAKKFKPYREFPNKLSFQLEKIQLVCVTTIKYVK